LQQSDPHGWLADPTIDPLARTAGEQQLGIWLQSGGTTRENTNPALLEMPAATIGNFDCLHYADPETGGAYSAPSYPMDSRECPTITEDKNAGWLAAVPLPEPAPEAPESRSGTLAAGAATLPDTSRGGQVPWPLGALGILGLGAIIAGGLRRRLS
jgi:hypothetical protein